MLPFPAAVAPSVRIAGYFVAIFLIQGTYLPFFPVYMSLNGVSEAQIGLVIAAPMVMRIVATPFTMVYADRLSDRRKALVLYSVCSLGIFSLLGFFSGFWPILLIVSAMAVFWTAVLPLSDALAVSLSRRDGSNYGRMRLWGSIAFIGANLGAGAIVEARGGDSVYLLLVAGLGLLVLGSLVLPKVERRPAQDEPGEGQSTFRLLSRPVFVLVLVAAGLAQASHAFLYGFGSIGWKALGFSGGEIGTLWAVGVIAEIVLFWLSGPVLGRVGPMGLLAIGAGAGVVRWALLPLAGDFPTVFAVQILHGLTFGATHLGIIHFVASALPERLASTGQGLAATSVSAAMATMVAVSGPLYEAVGGNGYFVMAVLSAAALGILALAAFLSGRARLTTTGAS